MYPGQNQQNQQYPPDPYRNQNPDPNPYPIDYLNQIAPKQQKPGMDNKKFLGLVGGGLAVALIVGMFVLFGGGESTGQLLQKYAARVEALQEVSKDTQKNLKSGDLRSINSNLSITLLDAHTKLAEPMATQGLDVKRIDSDIKAAEATDELEAKLEDARLNATLDRIYPREMSYQVKTVRALMKEIYAKTNSTSLKEYLDQANKSLVTVNDQLDDFSKQTD